MTASAPARCAEAEVLRQQARAVHAVIGMQTDGVTHEESLIQPQPAGNSLNWVIGHLVAVYNSALPILGQEPVTTKEHLADYQRGTPAWENGAKALPLSELLGLWNTAHERFDAGLGTLQSESLDQSAPYSPTGNPNETTRSLLTTIVFHQAYHTGQTALLRRIVGKPGAIK